MSFLTEPYEPEIKEAIARQLPHLTIERLEILTHGTECVAAELNDAYILKFPIPERTLDALTAEYNILHYLQGKVDTPIPNPELFEGDHPFILYPKLHGKRFNVENDYLLFCPLTPKEEQNQIEYVIRTDKEKEQLAEDIALFFAQTHAIDTDDLEAKGITFSPACILSTHNMPEFAGGNVDPAFARQMEDILVHAKQLQPADDNDLVFGHFDCTSGNMLYDKEQGRLSGIFDFGNAQIDDYHRDLSCMNLTAPALTKQIVKRYERLTGRIVDIDRMNFYTTFMHFYCITELSLRKAPKEVQLWQRSLARWNRILNNDDNTDNAVFPDSWQIWMAENLMLGTSIKEVMDILQKEGFKQKDIERELYAANLHPYVIAGRRCLERKKKNPEAHNKAATTSSTP